MKALLRWISGRCEVHDRAWPLRIAELEAATGIRPGAVAEMRSRYPADLTVSFADPGLIDCRSRRCRDRRGLQRAGARMTWLSGRPLKET